tara:strand:+ start:2800 stop:3552 length:753 start_codon:yes stop_codon:yes gene_type:complete
MRTKDFILLFFLSLFSLTIFSQETIFEEKTTIYDKEVSGGIGMHTNGFSAVYRSGKFITAFKKRVFEIEIANIKHPKEIRSVNPFQDNVRGYIFGKMNSFYALRPSIGIHKIFIPKQSINGVSVTFVSHFGPSIGMAKPVYLNIIEREPNQPRSIIVKEKYDPVKHQQGDIYGRASFLNGFNEMRFYPGLFAKFGFHFDFATSQDALRAIEVGAAIDVYFDEIPIMAFAENQSFFVNLYVNFLFGTREVR